MVTWPTVVGDYVNYMYDFFEFVVMEKEKDVNVWCELAESVSVSES